MQILAWKCERSGQLFESESAYQEHLEKMAQKDASEANRSDLLAQLDKVQRTPFEEATSVQDLVNRIVQAYPKAVELAIQLGDASPEMRQCKLVAVAGVQKLEFRWVDPDIAIHLELPEGSEGVSGDLTFLYEGDSQPTAAVDPVRLFPMLNAGTATRLSRASFPVSPGEKPGTQAVDVSAIVRLEHVPKLQALYEEFIGIRENEFRSLQEKRKVTEVVLREQDPEYLSATNTLEQIQSEMDALVLKRNTQEQRLSAAKQRLQQEAIAAIPRLAHFYDLMDALCVC